MNLSVSFQDRKSTGICVEMLDCMVFKCYTFVFLSVKVSQKQTRMSLRRQVIKDVGDIPSGDQQEDEHLDDGDDIVKNCEY